MARHQENRAVILNGPSKWDLMLALFDPRIGRSRRDVTLQIRQTDGRGESHKRLLSVVICQLGRAENGHEERWSFNGKAVDYDDHSGAIWSSAEVRGEYSTRTRKGLIEWVTPTSPGRGGER